MSDEPKNDAKPITKPVVGPRCCNSVARPCLICWYCLEWAKANPGPKK
jgi:hypothetical protein